MRAKSAVLTRAQQIEQIVKCGKDPVFFIKNYVKIQHPTRGTIPFETYPFQDDCVNQFRDNRHNIILKSRQLGLSTLCAAYVTWMAIFHKDKNILIIATKLSTAMNMIKKVRVAVESLPPWLLITKFEPTKQSISFANGSQIVAVPTSPDAGRSEALSLLIVDEAAIIHDFDEIWTGLAPTISTGGDCILLSTPKGVGGQYYRLWTQAEAGQNDFNTIRLPWHVHPEHDEEWFVKETKSLSRKRASQEYLCVGGDTKLVTTDGYKLAEEIVPGDRALTHQGRFRSVLAVNSRLVKQDEELYSVSSPGNRSDEFIITDNHPMLSFLSNGDPDWIDAGTVADSWNSSNRVLSALHPRLILQPQAIRTLDLAAIHPSIDIEDDTCRYPKQWGKTNRHLNVDFELGKFIGLYLAEGCSHRGGIDMGFHKGELETHVAWVEQYLERIGCRVTVLPNQTNNGCRLWTYNQHVGALVRYFISDSPTITGRRAPNKLLNWDRVIECGPEFIKGLVLGHHLGDGNHSYDKKTCTYSTSSRLVYQLRTLCSAFNLYPRIGIVEHSKKNAKHSDMWYLEFQTGGLTFEELLQVGQQVRKGSRVELRDGFFVGKHRLTPASQLVEQDGGYTVYDIQVEDDASFVAHSTILHNCDFIASGDTFLQPNDLEELRAQIVDPADKQGHDRNIWVWATPIPGRTYVISADVSRGDAHDYSAFHIIDTADCDVVAEYMGKVPPEKLADMLNEWGKRYNNALLVPENNTFGYFVNTKLRDVHGYKRLYYDKNRGDPFNYIPLDSNELPGFVTNQKTRVQILAKLEELIRSKTLKVHSQRLYDQLQAFVWNGNKPSASKDSYDDLIMSLAIGCWLVEGGEGIGEQAKAMAYAMLEATKLHRNDQMPGNVNEAQPLVNPSIRGYNPGVYRPRDAEQVQRQNPFLRDVGDFSWLMR